MSTTTELRGLLAAASAALAVWFVGIVLATYFIEPTPDVVVFAPRDRLVTALSGAPVAILDSRDNFLRLRGQPRGFVRALYGNGAWVVLPATTGGCRGVSEQSLPAPTIVR
jgi:hypothetical protein